MWGAPHPALLLGSVSELKDILLLEILPLTTTTSTKKHWMSLRETQDTSSLGHTEASGIQKYRSRLHLRAQI